MEQVRSLLGTHCVFTTRLLNFIFKMDQEENLVEKVLCRPYRTFVFPIDISPRVKTLGYKNSVPTGLTCIIHNSLRGAK